MSGNEPPHSRWLCYLWMAELGRLAPLKNAISGSVFSKGDARNRNLGFVLRPESSLQCG